MVEPQRLPPILCKDPYVRIIKMAQIEELDWADYMTIGLYFAVVLAVGIWVCIAHTNLWFIVLVVVCVHIFKPLFSFKYTCTASLKNYTTDTLILSNVV